MPMEEALDEFVRHRTENHGMVETGYERDIRKARNAPRLIVSKTLMNTIHSKRL